MKIVSMIRLGTTLVAVLVAAVLAWWLWRHYMYSPWTRDARVRAAVVEVAPEVSGRVVRVAVQDNQQVEKGDVLFVIDPARFRNVVQQAQANLDAAKAGARAAGASLDATHASARAAQATYAMRHSEAERRQQMGNVISREARSDAAAMATAAHAQWLAAQAGHGKAAASKAAALAAVEQAQAALALARLDLERTRVRAPMDGYVTHLDVYPGDYVQTGQERMALIGSDSFWIVGYFEETKLPEVHIGDAVDIRLMNGMHGKGRVQSIARGIADSENSTGDSLLATVKPTFSWVRLAQRIPVRIRIDPDSLPEDAHLAAGMTATVVLQAPTLTE